MKCPKCNYWKLSKIITHGNGRLEITYRCRRCGYESVEDLEENIDFKVGQTKLM
ncbi:MAG: hypothetical protein LBM02_08100 [Lachnospiraceae bacterium]|jgi:DNA-directed RNA polymerase subunit RPC12/RpoP|nr:hypothetical protein [Lachnospiraceae bacterium]